MGTPASHSAMRCFGLIRPDADPTEVRFASQGVPSGGATAAGVVQMPGATVTVFLDPGCTITLGGASVQIWQSRRFDPETMGPADVLDMPLLPTLLCFPVFLRCTGVATIGQLRKLLLRPQLPVDEPDESADAHGVPHTPHTPRGLHSLRGAHDTQDMRGTHDTQNTRGARDTRDTRDTHDAHSMHAAYGAHQSSAPVHGHSHSHGQACDPSDSMEDAADMVLDDDASDAPDGRAMSEQFTDDDDDDITDDEDDGDDMNGDGAEDGEEDGDDGDDGDDGGDGGDGGDHSDHIGDVDGDGRGHSAHSGCDNDACGDADEGERPTKRRRI